MLNPDLNWTELKQSFLIDGRIRIDNIFQPDDKRDPKLLSDTNTL